MIKHLTPKSLEEITEHINDMSAREKQCLLFDAIYKGNIKEIKIYTKYVNRNARMDISFSPLDWALNWKQTEAVKCLIELGVNTSELTEFGKKMLEDILKEANDKTSDTKN